MINNTSANNNDETRCHLEIVRELLLQHFLIILHEIRSIELCSYFRGRVPHEHGHYPRQQLGTQPVLAQILRWMDMDRFSSDLSPQTLGMMVMNTPRKRELP